MDETYEVDARLGAGGMGEVYAARHVKLGKRVAIKVIRSDLSQDAVAIERFALEAQTLARIQHPAIVAVEHVGELVDGRAFFVMEYLCGEPLFERLQRGRVPLPEALHVLDQMARGLEAAHASSVIHRDLKPENTFLVYLPGEPPVVKLLDFGLSKLVVESTNLERTQSGTTVGTPMYMSPEQARGVDVDHRTDIYALGCVAYELVLGVRPFARAKTVAELYVAHLHSEPPIPRTLWPEIPPQLDLALFAMLAKNPSQRPTLVQTRAVVAAVAATLTNRAEPRSTAKLVERRNWSKKGTTVVAAVTLVSGMAIGSLLTIAMSGSKAPLPVSPLQGEPPATSSPVPPPPTPSSNGNSAPSLQPPPPTVPSKQPSRALPNPPSKPAIVPNIPQPVPQPPSDDRNQTVNPFKSR